MYACGLRISEATTLEVSAIDRANQVLRIVGKESIRISGVFTLRRLERSWQNYRSPARLLAAVGIRV